MGYKKNKFLFLYLMIQFFFINIANSQTGIGTPSPDASAKLDVYSTNKGFLPPRVTLTGISDNSTIASPATGLLVYNTGTNVGLAAGYYYWNGNAWATIATAGGSGSFAASFLRGSRTAVQSSIAVGGIVSFSTVDNTSGSDITLSTSDGKITLRPGNTYRLIAAVPNFTGNRPAFMWYNETSSSYIGSATNGYSPTDGASGAGAFGGIAEVIITPSVSTVLSFRLLSSLSSGAITVGGLADFSTTGSYPWFEAQVISGNTPVTGQSVDYIQASLSTNQALSAAGNIIFNTSSGTGISITSGGFNLIANKTYKLEAAIGGTSGGYAYYAWVDNSNNLLPGGSIGAVMKAGTAYTDAPQDKAVVYFTPTVDTRVFLRVYSLSGTLTAYAPSTSSNYSSSWANISQIGSSAFVSPWTLSGSNTYNTSGNVGIGTNNPTSLLNIAGGGVRIASGLGNTSSRPSVNTSTIGNYEIRGVGGGTSQNDTQDDGFLRLSAGGGTNAIQQSSIDLSGYSNTVSDMNSNIVMRTAGVERLRIDNSGNLGIGTSSPSASAILDVSSSSKGILIPRMTASQRSAISSPTTGLLIFQTDAPSDFYYYNGSTWVSLREPNWTSAGTIQSVGWSATTTAPTIGTTTVNDYSYKQIGSKTWRCQLTFSAGGSSTGANNGSGDYLFTLPNGLQFNTSIAGQAAYSANVGQSIWDWPGLWLSSSSGSITNLSQGGLLYVVPYSSTQYRLIHVGIAGVGAVIPYASGYYGVGSNISWRLTFTFQSL